MIVVADASPLIFLGKVRRLGLVSQLLGDDIRLPRSVYAEIVAPGLDPSEERALALFLQRCRVESVRRPQRFAAAMSRADNAALSLALQCHADTILCDEHLMRVMARSEGIRPLGTLGILLLAMRQRLLTSQETRCAVDDLVRSHSFHIGVRLYQYVRSEIESAAR